MDRSTATLCLRRGNALVASTEEQVSATTAIEAAYGNREPIITEEWL
ncbi:MAG: hypothetical protein K5867_08775 [Bacteroidales bacterium]|nr:hypothetical protein [Bacteroidales bacterium]